MLKIIHDLFIVKESFEKSFFFFKNFVIFFALLYKNSTIKTP